jgi:adenylate kinase family enzyme
MNAFQSTSVERVVIFGNSGAGKSTLAKQLVRGHGLSHLDLDTLAWLPASPPTRKPVPTSASEIEAFIKKNDRWVIEGCYADLLELVAPHCSEMIFLNPGVEACIRNCQSRPWEPHKYASKEAQNANLEMLIEWVRNYPTHRDEFSLEAHRRLFDQFQGAKTERT